jgi:hypothetical protein
LAHLGTEACKLRSFSKQKYGSKYIGVKKTVH